MDFAVLKTLRRLNQSLQVVFSPTLCSPSASDDSIRKRYGSSPEVTFYQQQAQSGFEELENQLITDARKLLPKSPSVLVVGCGAGREAFAFSHLGCRVTGIDIAEEMITAAKKIESPCSFYNQDVFELKDQKFDLIYISQAINGHIFGFQERLRFYRRLNNLCQKSGLLISVPEIKELTVNDHYYWASQVLRLRHFVDGNWQEGDTARSFLGNHNSDHKLNYYHFYPTYHHFEQEMRKSGFQKISGQEFIFKPLAINAFKPKIVQIAKFFPPENNGGMESALSDLSLGLVKSGFYVHCVVNSDRPNLAKSENPEGLTISRCPTQAKFMSTAISIPYLKEISELSGDLNHLHIPNPTTAAVGLIGSVPLVISYHCDVLTYPLFFKFYKPWLNLQLKKASAIIVSSPQLRDFSPMLLPYREKCQVIPFGVNPSYFKIRRSIQQSLQDLKRIYGKPLLLFVGRLVPYKGLSYLIRALRETNALLVVVGDGPEQNRLRRLVNQSNLEEAVHFFGNVSRQDLGAFYQESDAVVLPSIDAREAFGICLIEALAFGKPLITTEVGTGTSFVNQNETTGYIVPPKNEKILAAKINQLFSDHDRLLNFGQAARTRFDQLFSYDVMIQSYVKLYEKILGYHLPR